MARLCLRVLLTLAASTGVTCAAELPAPGVYRSVDVNVEAAGPVCGIGTPLTPAYLLRVGPIDDPFADDAIGVLVDDAATAMPIVRNISGRLEVMDPTEPKDSSDRRFGHVTPSEDLALGVEYWRNDFACKVRGTIRFVPSADSADARRVDRLTRASLLAGARFVQRGAGNPRAALAPARAAQALLREELGDGHVATLMAAGAIASLHKDLGAPAIARPIQEGVIAGLTAQLGPDHAYVLSSINNLALLLWDQGDLGMAEEKLRHVAARYANVLGPNDGNQLGTLTNLATLLGLRGRHVEAEAMLRDVVVRRERAFGPDHPATLATINNLANAYAASGWLDEADAQFRLVYERADAAFGARHPVTLRARHSLAQQTLQRADFGLAVQQLREMLPLRREVLGARHTQTLVSQSDFASALGATGALAEAVALQREVVAIRTEDAGATHFLTLQSQALLGRLESRAGEHDAAAARLRRAHGIAAAILGADDRNTLEIALALADAQHAARARTEARATLARVVTAVERWRASGGFTAARRAAFFAPWARAYKQLAVVHFELHDVAAAFDEAERSKARVLVESLALRRGEAASILPPDALARLAALDARVAALEVQQSRATDQVQRVALAQEIANALSAAAAERTALRARYPRYAEIAQPRLVSVRDGARMLGGDAVFVSYLVHDERVLAFTLVRNGTLRGHDLGTVKGLAGLVTAYRALLAPQGNAVAVWKLPDGTYSVAARAPEGAVRVRDADAIGAQLHARLVRPLPALTRARQWIIAPDGPLGLVPFEALPERGRPLVLSREIRYTSSLTVHTLTAQRGREYSSLAQRAPLYAMGAALYDDAPATTGATEAVSAATVRAAPQVDAARLADALATDRAGTRRAFDRLGRRWPALPASMREIESVAAVFGPRGSVVVRARDDATEARLREDDRSGLLARQRYVLLSAHGYLSTETPSLSAVVLGQQGTTDDDDGYVTAAEWAGYTLRSDLIVVSACETGVGRVIEGEGIAGLPYAFFVAGNRNALLTLWPVSDQSAAAFVVRFFALIDAGRSQADALATVKREFARSGRFRAPLHWAPFVLWGS